MQVQKLVAFSIFVVGIAFIELVLSRSLKNAVFAFFLASLALLLATGFASFGATALAERRVWFVLPFLAGLFIVLPLWMSRLKPLLSFALLDFKVQFGFSVALAVPLAAFLFEVYPSSPTETPTETPTGTSTEKPTESLPIGSILLWIYLGSLALSVLVLFIQGIRSVFRPQSTADELGAKEGPGATGAQLLRLDIPKTEKEVHDHLRKLGSEAILQIHNEYRLVDKLKTRGDGFCFFHAYLLSSNVRKDRIEPEQSVGIEAAERACKYAEDNRKNLKKNIPGLELWQQKDIDLEIDRLRQRLTNYKKKVPSLRIPFPDGSFWKEIVMKVDEKVLKGRKIHIASSDDGCIYNLWKQGIQAPFWHIKQDDILIGNYGQHFEGFVNFEDVVVVDNEEFDRMFREEFDRMFREVRPGTFERRLGTK